jgi:hypothetical protein
MLSKLSFLIVIRKDWNCCSLRNIQINCRCRPVGSGCSFLL